MSHRGNLTPTTLKLLQMKQDGKIGDKLINKNIQYEKSFIHPFINASLYSM